MQSLEECREALSSLQRENERLRNVAARANLLLRSLDSLLQIDMENDPFVSVFESLRGALAFDQVMVLTETDGGSLSCISADPARLAGTLWPVGPSFARIMGGRVSTTVTSRDLEEWRDIPAALLSPEQPALYLPISVSDGRGILVLLRAAGTACFSRSDVAIAREYALLASHALAGLHARRLIEKYRAWAIAAEDANRTKNLFIANMSHELRTPLNAIIGFSEFISAESYGALGSPRYAEYVRDIHASGNHLLGIVNNLLLFSKIEAGQHEARLDDLSLREELASVERMLQFDASRHRVQLVCDRVDAGLYVRADQQSLRQILINVIGNAIKFSPSEEIVRVELDTGRDGSRHFLRVVDRGCGIPAQTLTRLGNPFVQADGAFSRRYQGTGLGLAICFGLAEAMGAKIAIESAEAEGTTVTISLPAAASRPAEHPLAMTSRVRRSA